MRDRRRCAACGVGLPADAARCPTCGHADGDPIVAVGQGNGSDERARGRRPVLVAVAAVLALVAVLAVVDRRSGSGDDTTAAGSDLEATTTTERSTQASRRSNTPTTPPDRSFESTIPLESGHRLLGWVAPGWGEIIDPATGLINSTRLASGSEFITVVPRLGGAVVLSGGSATAQWYAELPTGAEPSLVQAGVAEVYPSDIENRVWLVRTFDPLVFVEVDVTSGQMNDEVRLPAGAWVRGSVDGGLVVDLPGGLFVYRRGEERFQPVATGEYVASSGTLVAYRRCDERLSCPVFVRDMADGSEFALDGFDASIDGSYLDGAFSPDGRWLAVVVEESAGWRIVVFDTATGGFVPVSAGPARSGAFVQLAWTPDGEWLLWPDYPGIRGYHPADNTAALIDTGGGAYQGVVVLDGPMR